MNNMNIAICLHLISFIIFASGIVYYICLAKKKKFNQRIARLTLLLIIALIPLNLYPTPDNPAIPFAVMPKTLQAFSVDVDYPDAFSLKPFSEAEPSEPAAIQTDGTTPDTKTPWSALVVFFMIYKSVIYTAAPILGGVVIYDVFVGVSPHVRLFFVRKRRLYVFSELNLRSVCLAESIDRDKKRGRRPILVFAHCGAETSDGAGPELRLKAKALRAVCIPEGLSSGYGLRNSREIVIFLMTCCGDGTFDEAENLSVLHTILNKDEPIWPVERGCNIFCFTNRAETVENIRAAKHDFDQVRHDDHCGEVVLHVVRDYAQAANTLMERHPLYEALAGKPSCAPLKTLIIGNNDFSREMFKTVFWCGQLLDHPLELAVAYATGQPVGDGMKFEQWLEVECPELMKSCIAGSDCLRVTREGGFNAPYASLCFAEVPPHRFYSHLLLDEVPTLQYGTAEKKPLSQYDYIIVMVGSDKQNIAMMECLWRQLTYWAIEGNAVEKKIIMVAIEDPELSRLTLLRYQALKKEMDVANVFTFGSVDSRFRWENVFKKGVYVHNREASDSFSDAMHILPGFNASKDDIYNELSSDARQIHLKYKMACALGRSPAGPENLDGVLRDKIEYCEAVQRDKALYDRLSWLEHRRWNAFLRTQGFRQPPHLEAMLSELALGRCEDADSTALRPYAYKNVPARLHPDLVESVSGIRAEPRDLLDLASDMRILVDVKAGKEPDRHDIKYYDRPNGKYGPILNRAEVCACLLGADPAMDAEALKAAWSEVEKRCPEIEKCADARYPGRYFAEAILALRQQSRIAP